MAGWQSARCARANLWEYEAPARRDFYAAVPCAECPFLTCQNSAGALHRHGDRAEATPIHWKALVFLAPAQSNETRSHVRSENSARVDKCHDQ